jgi:hypothetical protein
MGLVLFACVSIQAMRQNPAASRYFWWAGVPLDSEPLNKSFSACKEGVVNCDIFGPESINVRPSTLARGLVMSALPAFVLSELVAGELGQRGISAVYSFLISMPLLTAGWFYFVGWMIDPRKPVGSAGSR